MRMRQSSMTQKLALAAACSAALAVLLAGCPNPTPEQPTLLKGTLTGKVTNALTDQGIEGVTVSLTPAIDATITTDADGAYSQEVPLGIYTVTFEESRFASQTITTGVVGGATTTLDASLTPTQSVSVTITTAGDPTPGSAVTATANVEILDGATTVTSYAWAQSNSVDVSISGATSQTATVTLPNAAAYKAELAMLLKEPPISQAQLPSNVVIPTNAEGEYVTVLPERFQVVPLNPFIMEEAGMVTLEVTVVTSSGTYTAETEVLATLPWSWTTGLHNVPLGIAVLLYGPEQDSYDWALTRASGSSATLTDATTNMPYFTPDVAGLYTITVTDNTVDPAVEKTLEIYAGRWQGAITGQDANGLPVAENCTICHGTTIAEGDQFETWAATGHAAIFTDQINTGDHYSTSCLPCHTVGYDPSVDNGGIDDTNDWDDFIAQDYFHHAAAGNWTEILADQPETAQLANVQCENCHGPQAGGAHGMGTPRISLAADVCGYCHGEPVRHGRFQQWQLSAHADYETAIGEGESGNCSRCHTANGFTKWAAVINDDDDATDPTASITVDWETDDIHPITCVVCHDPHNVGTVSGDTTDAPLRIQDDSPPLLAGFTALGMGKGAICITCHNSRRGLRNDGLTVADGSLAQAPHLGTQGDLLMGQNGYFVTAGVRGRHSLVTNTCVICHMQETPAPDLLAYNQGGTNHTFFASPEICSSCHGEKVTAAGVQDAFTTTLGELETAIEDAMLALIEERIAAGDDIDLGGERTISDAADIASIALSDSHGQQAIIVTFTDDDVVGPIAMGDVKAAPAGKIAEPVALYIYDKDDHSNALWKSFWNYLMLESDGSHGVHNPSFEFEMMAGAIDALTSEYLSVD